jgi:hypothetical protein
MAKMKLRLVAPDSELRTVTRCTGESDWANRGGDARIAQQIFQKELPPCFAPRRRRQNALFGFAVVERIVDLYEIGPLAQEHRFDGTEVAVPC